MKRLVICCDGTWNRPDSPRITNIEKIARTIQTDLEATGQVQQLVLYLTGVGAGYRVDRVLGGAFGYGLFTNIVAGYRFLAQNYEAGDEIFVFGFSRGAYTARSLVGMIGKVGLLTRRALVDEKLPEAVARYRGTRLPAGESGQSTREFKRDYCHADTPVEFLGVFDTVGALGVPGAWRRAHQFHDVKLSEHVRCARQALAADETRMKFEPCLWEVPATDVPDGAAPGDPDRVKQVWFEGAHSDVGGGYAETGLSDTALLWMVCEANKRGLVFDEVLLRTYVGSGSSCIRHDPLKWPYRMLNAAARLRAAVRMSTTDAFMGVRRRLHNDRWLAVRVAECTADHYRGDERYRPPNLAAFERDTDGFSGVIESVIGLPEPDYDDLVARLATRGVSLGATRARPAPVGTLPAQGEPRRPQRPSPGMAS